MAGCTFNPSPEEDEAGGLPFWASLGYRVRPCTQCNLDPVTPDLGLVKSFGYPPKSFVFPKQDSGKSGKPRRDSDHPQLWRWLPIPDSPLSTSSFQLHVAQAGFNLVM